VSTDESDNESDPTDESDPIGGVHGQPDTEEEMENGGAEMGSDDDNDDEPPPPAYQPPATYYNKELHIVMKDIQYDILDNNGYSFTVKYVTSECIIEVWFAFGVDCDSTEKVDYDDFEVKDLLTGQRLYVPIPSTVVLQGNNIIIVPYPHELTDGQSRPCLAFDDVKHFVPIVFDKNLHCMECLEKKGKILNLNECRCDGVI